MNGENRKIVLQISGNPKRVQFDRPDENTLLVHASRCYASALRLVKLASEGKGSMPSLAELNECSFTERIKGSPVRVDFPQSEFELIDSFLCGEPITIPDSMKLGYKPEPEKSQIEQLVKKEVAAAMEGQGQ